MFFILAFIVAVVFNFAVIVFGKDAVEQFKGQMSIGKYLKEINRFMVEAVGDKGATIIKLLTIGVIVILVLTNIIGTLLMVFGIFLGTFLAKKVCRMSAVANFLNKVATYINRLR